MFKHVLIVGMGGFIGSVGRFLVSKYDFSWDFHSIPLGTLLVNILGSFIIGLIAGLSAQTNIISTEIRLFMMVGIAGGFTTFSAFTHENLLLFHNGQFLSIVLYTGLSILLGFIAVYLGYFLVNLFF